MNRRINGAWRDLGDIKRVAAELKETLAAIDDNQVFSERWKEQQKQAARHNAAELAYSTARVARVAG